MTGQATRNEHMWWLSWHRKFMFNFANAWCTCYWSIGQGNTLFNHILPSGQAIEIGTVAINILIDTWEGHLTPTEVATLTDKASRGRDPNMVAAAAELALSCLAHAQALNPQETKRALLQCKEQSNNMLEKVRMNSAFFSKDYTALSTVPRLQCQRHQKIVICGMLTASLRP